MIERQQIEATKGEKVQAKFDELADAEAAVERLKAAGFNEDTITLTTHGGHTEPDGTFVRGGIEVVVLADARADDAERILAQKRDKAD
ncbi:MAG: hypothetical protein E6I57_11850 [Chloroflexi bacterium]|nr:MAG: hypothetical protein E6J49_04835 [Chloroflexota bacterium]TMB79390.1 MAG: hypothetical protein E6J52_02790 [Chloroflexota bacterium]TMB93596.1 MAG: hypothetical protein E6J38_10480 [Chloroflexota bacterium]TMC28368.1 MAG: hypothetical protein E6J27_08665 [Chloroflexota bacterium]TMC34443.1 MAG: hypothetical protein E6J24_06260 [Chloroflexota bacterium]